MKLISISCFDVPRVYSKATKLIVLETYLPYWLGFIIGVAVAAAREPAADKAEGQELKSP